MKKSLWIFVLSIFLQNLEYQRVAAQQVTAQESSPTLNTDEELAASVGTQLYIYGLPVMLEYQFRNKMLAVAKNFVTSDGQTKLGNAADGIQYNEWLHVKWLATHLVKTGASPNEDTIYSVMFADVSKEPLILTVPPIKNRYYNIQISDAYLENVHYIGTSKNEVSGGEYALVGPNFKGTLPKNIKKLRMPHNFFIPIIRLQVRDRKEDLIKAIPLQESFKAQTLGSYLGKEIKKTDVILPSIPKTGLEWFSALLNMMKENPPIARDSMIIAQMNFIGLKLDGTNNINSLSASTKKGLERAFIAGKKIVAQAVMDGKETKSHWLYNYDYGTPKQNYLVRAAYSLWGLTTHSKEEAIYFRGNYDSNRQLLDGKNKYTITFDKDKKSPCRFFWSITSYDERDFVLNSDFHYSASNDREHPAKLNADGSLTLYIQAEQPEGVDIGNWIPTTKEGPFQLMYRLYSPDAVMFDTNKLDEYLPPIILKN